MQLTVVSDVVQGTPEWNASLHILRIIHLNSSWLMPDPLFRIRSLLSTSLQTVQLILVPAGWWIWVPQRSLSLWTPIGILVSHGHGDYRRVFLLVQLIIGGCFFFLFGS